MRTVNVIEVCYPPKEGNPEVSVRSFEDTKKGNKEAEEFFLAILRYDQGLSEELTLAYLEAGAMFDGTDRTVCIEYSV